jgi:N-acetylglutamate synthase-like GNAT family acetyltransferase
MHTPNLLANDHLTAARLEHCDATRSWYFAQARAALRPESGSSWLDLPGGGSVTYSGPGMPNCRAKGLGFNGSVPPEAIEAAEAFFAGHCGVPSFDICPLGNRSLMEQLASRGYHLVKFYTILAMPIPTITLPVADGIEVRQAHPNEDELWARLTGSGFNNGQPCSDESFEIMLTNFHAANARPYLAFIDGQPVGGGGMFLDGDTAELGGTSVLPDFRRRGVQTALVQRRLEDAAAQRVTLAMLLTIPGSDSQHNLERMGFRVMYSKAVVKREEWQRRNG